MTTIDVKNIEVNKYTTPIDYKIRLPKFREHQLETIKAIGSSNKEHVVVNAPTGSGKSAVGMALSKELIYPIRVLTKSRSLQDQYADKKYNGIPLYGLAAYPCALFPSFTASDCVFPTKMTDCPRAGSCQYLQKKQEMLEHDRQILSYQYWMVAEYLKAEKYFANLYLDECHELPAITMKNLEKRFDKKWEKYNKQQLPSFPSTENQSVLRTLTKKWLSPIATEMKEEIEYLKTLDQQRIGKRLSRISRELTEISGILFQLEHFPDEMMVIVDNEGFFVAPLSARMFKSVLLTSAYEKAIFTSATVGNVGTLMGALGFSGDDYDYINVPSRFPPESMPIYVPNDAPALNYKSGDATYQKQAELAYKIITDHPNEWSGFIHTASKSHAYAIANRLKKLGLGNRIWVTPEGSSSLKIQHWMLQKIAHPNTLVVSWDMWQGVDGFDEEMNIICKIPYGTLDKLGKARMERDKKFYIWEAASKVEQAAGRNRRGDENHYEANGTDTRRICAVLDASISRVKGQLSPLAIERLTYGLP